MSACGEKDFAEAYADGHSESFIGFKYPDWHNQIVIEEHLND
ncbi:hypothetical protein fHeYen901_132 [Yersinia phage fHe-Yen9-01]|uniref:Uncharacterized protein n=1 Tax=Yersinia phage fHe-Yen9-01 TaxID=1965363 RepID=A0A1V0DXN4_9CAUD|nr:hypothetical protein KNT60_gp131 [Yersinia phage fHe-Yen9-01]ARB05905.1 hypothetical protein fHeYen901_132 [Yersinia phage fHe-Yen9-01]